MEGKSAEKQRDVFYLYNTERLESSFLFHDHFVFITWILSSLCMFEHI